MVRPGDEKVVTATGRGRLRAPDDDREQVVDTLKIAFVEDRLTKDEFDARIGQALAARTQAELAAVTADIPAWLTGTRPVRKPPRRPASNAVRWGRSGFVTPAIVAAALAFSSLHGGGGYGAVALVIAFAYFVFWLSVGADMLWQWFAMSLPSERMCVRCAHTAGSHRAPASCQARHSSVWRRCQCAGYVPPGRSPETVDG